MFLTKSLAYFSLTLENGLVPVGTIKVRESWLFDSRGRVSDPEEESAKPSISGNSIGIEVRESLSMKLEWPFEYMLELISIGKASRSLFMLAVRDSKE